MLSYAFTELHKKGYKRLATEEFENIYELYSEILILGINKQLKRGIEKTYINQEKQLSTLRGKINITDSINPLIKHRQLLCEYDEFNINSYKNRIIKTTIINLLKQDISKIRRKKLRKLLVYFVEVDELDIHNINWNLRFNRNNQTYIMLINICYLVFSSMLQSTAEGSTKLITLTDDNMPHLYEKFILEYYKREHKEVKAEASYISWQLDDENDLLLPTMKSDITLSDENNVLIIDAKYYKKTLQEHYSNKSVHSNNLYQIFTYVKNRDVELKEKNMKVSGMLLYAKTDEEQYPDNTYNMSGSKISVKTLDLNQDFDGIKEQLDDIVYEHFN